MFVWNVGKIFGHGLLSFRVRRVVEVICGDGTRERTRAFTELVSHYLFQDRFARPARGNDKGSLQQRVGVFCKPAALLVLLHLR